MIPCAQYTTNTRQWTDRTEGNTYKAN